MLIADRHMFPLKLLYGTAGDHYFLSTDNRIFSTRASANPTELRGTDRAGDKIFKLGLGRLLSAIVRDAKSHPRWSIETTGIVQPVFVAERSYAATVDAGIKARGIIIGRVHKGALVFGSAPRIHTTEASVKAEITRLAVEHPGVKFVRLAITGAVVAGGVTWE